MVECEYCDASFADDDRYLEHLGAAHEGELGPIDRRRVEDLDVDGDAGGFPTGPVALGAVLLVAGALVVYLTVVAGSDSGLNTQLPDRGDQSVVSQVTTEQAQTNRHVEPGSSIEYAAIPPSSGAHYPPGSETEAGFYTETQPLGSIVHSLEHGAVVVWYDQDEITPETEESLKAFARAHQRPFGSFIAVPTPVDSPEHPYVLTAWEHRLALEDYSHETVREFAGEYLGRGPEGAYR